MFKSWLVDFDPVRAKMDGRWRRGDSLLGMPAVVYDLFPNRPMARCCGWGRRRQVLRNSLMTKPLSLNMIMKVSNNMDVNINVPALRKLLEYAASGIGSIAGPLLASWKARAEVKAKLIAAEGEVEAQRILAEGQSDVLQIVARATADAREKLSTPNTTMQGQLSVGEMVAQKIQFQEEKRQANILSVIDRAVEEVGEGEVPDKEPDHDWTARFFNDIQDVSSEEMQTLWAKVLAGEVAQPGSTSMRTLSILRSLDKATAGLFRKLCSACVSLRLDGPEFWDARVPSLGGNAGTNSLQKYGLSFDKLNVLNEHGLIISDYNSWCDLRMCLGAGMFESKLVRFPFNFQGRYWVLESSNQRDKDQEFRLSGVALTRSGRELLEIVDLEPMNEYTQDLMKFFEAEKLRMTEVGSWRPHV